MASIRSYRTAGGDRRYSVRYRDPAGRNRSTTFSLHKDAQAFKLDIERRHQAGLLYQAPPERFGDVAQAWLERFVIGAAGRVRPRPKTIRVAEDCPLPGTAQRPRRRAHPPSGGRRPSREHRDPCSSARGDDAHAAQADSQGE